ncbi:Uma2 family endonuclease [Aetokthonos hydrillicola Thurmond2011]|jgi:Uma2 family endonuclease|uniref:Uma2 family endonuclease n=1 Tax=Aetokthonos hydrillicola Thurmond2011 TaxID=2712845 RepID=A0AAP5I9Z8_9CYAN|nr:Uma2 family endonuclease [Aetokthonos hydrillicola]MBO3461517.1 Uma2 family endonuclease [Aetokthonos hydrillicola CCALA 1050]MBW4584656.1 Uma2 family endonuclease [Aetokthonos hydrillicola CCALA 1050]MDR9895200.1 Uma2 family endonuclease [Aetokthonos hydrillicola Thurmond2011]
MTQAASKLLTFDDFIRLYGDNDRYELIDGELVDTEPTGQHEEVAAFILRKVNIEIDRMGMRWFTPTRCLIKPLGTKTAFRPDVVVLDKAALSNEPLWQDQPIITLGSSVKLVVEVVSTNWQNDYARKVEDYSAIGIPEYWVIDYLGLGGRDYIGNPKQPTISIYLLSASGNQYQKPSQFRGRERIISPTFNELQLTAEQIFAA